MASDPYPDKRRGTWVMKYRPDPKGPWVAVKLGDDPRLTGPRPPAKPPQAIIDRAKEFAEIEYRAKHGIAAAPARAKGLEDYVASALAAHKLSAKAGSHRLMVGHARNFLAFCLARGVSSVQGVTPAVCRDYLEHRAGLVMLSTAKSERGYLSGIWTRAVDDGLMVANPWGAKAAKLKAKPPDSEPTFWSREELAAIVAACRIPYYRDLVLVLANTGLRISTALAMEWSWVDWSAGTIRIGKGEGVKTQYVHALGRVARDVLTRLRFAKGDNPLVLPSPRTGKRLAYTTANRGIARAVRRAGATPGTPHDFRHSYGRLMILAGVPVTVVQSQLGHTTLAQTLKYVRTGEETAAQFVGEIGFGEASSG